MITVATNPTLRADCTTLPCNTLCYHCVPKEEKNKSHQAILPLCWREFFLPDVSAVVVVVVFVGHDFNKALKEKCERKKFAPRTQPKSFPFAKQRGAHKTLTNKTLTANPNWLCISLRTYSSRCRAGQKYVSLSHTNTGIRRVFSLWWNPGRAEDQTSVGRLSSFF